MSDTPRPHTLAELAEKVYPQHPTVTPPSTPDRPTGLHTPEQLAAGMYPDAGGDLHAALRPFMTGAEASAIANSREQWTRETAHPAAMKLLTAEFGAAGAKQAFDDAVSLATSLHPEAVAKAGNNPHAVLAFAKAAARRKGNR